MKRVLATGASGLIGRETIQPLLEEQYEVYAISRRAVPQPSEPVNWISGDMLDHEFLRGVVREIRPTHLLNLAWTASGDYLTSDDNYRFLEAGIVLAEAFARHGGGGGRAVYAGSCFEYDLNRYPLKEDSPLDAGKMTYTLCKDRLRRAASAIFARSGTSFCHSRIFCAFGRNERKTRLTGMVIDALESGRELPIKSGALKRDWIYSREAARALVALLGSDCTGVVNICTGEAVSVRDYVLKLANALGKRPDGIEFRDDYGNQPRIILGNNTRLIKEVGYKFKYTMNEALREIADAHFQICGRNPA